jgi:hypothetical protein
MSDSTRESKNEELADGKTPQRSGIIELPLINLTPDIFNSPEFARKEADRLNSHTQAISNKRALHNLRFTERLNRTTHRKNSQVRLLENLAYRLENLDSSKLTLDSDVMQTLLNLKQHLGKGSKSLHLQFAETDDPTSGNKVLSLVGFKELTRSIYSIPSEKSKARPKNGEGLDCIQFAEFLKGASSNRYVKVSNVTAPKSERKLVEKILQDVRYESLRSEDEANKDSENIYLVYPPEHTAILMSVIRSIMEMPPIENGLVGGPSLTNSSRGR